VAQATEQGRDQRLVAQKAVPIVVVKIGGDDCGESTVPLFHQLEEDIGLPCQMAPAVFDQTVIEIDAGRVGLRANGQVMRFAGYLAIYAEAQDEASPDDEAVGSLPDIHQDETLRLLGCQPEQHFTQLPPRYSEATLVRELEEKGVGRPSTYATILSTIQDRGYVEKKEGRLGPTELGVVVNGLLVKSFPEIVSTDFTALMEEQLDQVEEGAVDWVKLLRDFYGPFEKDLARAKVEMRDLKREEEPTEEVCEKCGKPMVIKWGRNGYFLACSGYPDCRNTKEYTRNADGSLTAPRPSATLCRGIALSPSAAPNVTRRLWCRKCRVRACACAAWPTAVAGPPSPTPRQRPRPHPTPRRRRYFMEPAKGLCSQGQAVVLAD